MCERRCCFWLCAVNKDKKPPISSRCAPGPQPAVILALLLGLRRCLHRRHTQLRRAPRSSVISSCRQTKRRAGIMWLLPQSEPLRCCFEHHTGLLNSEYLGYFGCENTAGVWGLWVIHLPQCEWSCNTASCRTRACLSDFVLCAAACLSFLVGFWFYLTSKIKMVKFSLFWFHYFQIWLFYHFFLLRVQRLRQPAGVCSVRGYVPSVGADR